MGSEAPRLVAFDPIQSLAVVGHNADAAVATLAHYVVLLWRRNIVPEALRWIGEAFAKVGHSEPGRKLVFLTAVVPRCNVSTPTGVRKGIAEILKSHEDAIACAAIVFEGEGFHMTVVRSIITAINMASRTRFPNAVFSKLDQGLFWIHQHDAPGSSVDAPHVLQAIDKLRVL